MPTPSLLIVPSRFKSGKLYSQIPTSGAGDFTVTRATNATRVNASGFIESVASGIPRLDYFASDGTVGCPALLVEPSAQNLAFHSENWGSNWTLDGTTRATGSTDAFKAPDGTFTANAISPTSGTVAHIIYSNNTTQITFVSGTIYTQSAFFKAGTGVGTRVQLSYTGTRFSQQGFANFDLSAGSVTLVSGVISSDPNRAASIENYGNGWYRCRFTATCTSNGAALGLIPTLISASGDSRQPSFQGTVTDVLYGWGAQLETGSVATSYIPTTTAAVTRNADVVLVSGAVSGSIGQTQGTIYAEVDIRNLTTADFARIVTLRETANANNFFEIEKRSSTQLRISARLNSGTTITFLTHPNAFQLGTNKIAFAYQDGNYAMGFNGVVATSSQAGMTASLNQVNLGSSTSSVAQLNDRILAAALYTTRLSNAELAALTSL